MPKLAAADDYPDDPKRNPPDGVNVLALLRAGKPAVKSWAKASPRRSLAPNGQLLAAARVEVVASAPGGGHYLSRSQRRAPVGREVGRWYVWVFDAAVGRRIYVLPEGVVVRAVAIDDAKTLTLAVTASRAIAKALGLASADVELVLAADQLEQLPTEQRAAVAPAGAFAQILRIAGHGGAALARAAKAATAAANPTPRAQRALVHEVLTRVRPALVADLRRRIFKHPFPPGTEVLAFEVFHDDFEPLPILGYPCKANGDQVQTFDAQGRPSVAPYLTLLPGRRIVPVKLANRFSVVELDVVPILIPWFVACWKEAGGAERFPLRATIQPHDDMRPRRLPTAAKRAR